MTNVTLKHFERAAIDIGAHGDNDTLPFDLDNRFIKDKYKELAQIAYRFFHSLEKKGAKEARNSINGLQIFSERLLVPTGPAGFRITTKIHPFWNIYFNGLGVAIAEKFENQRSERAHSYRFIKEGEGLFDRDRSWRSYREATLKDRALNFDDAVVIQTDISSFYEHIYHHRLENCIKDLFSENSTVATQIDRLLNQFSSGRSFGLPVGGQCARILAELLMSSIDQLLTDSNLVWHRYVDDFTLIAKSQEEAYKALSTISHALADYGLSLNRSKTTILSAKHYIDYVNTQLGITDNESRVLREIDLHFDPYSDTKIADYSELKQTVQKLDVQALLNLELKKAQPDTYLVSQITRTLKFHSPLIATQLCSTLLDSKNLHAFRASWSTIMRGIAAIYANSDNEDLFYELDHLVDLIPSECPHLLQAEASCLHYLRVIRNRKTESRAKFISDTYRTTTSITIKRACIDCWRIWKHRPQFITLRNTWTQLSENEQRMIWLAYYDLGDDGRHARKQVKQSLPKVWALGIEQEDAISFCELYQGWAQKNGL